MDMDKGGMSGGMSPPWGNDNGTQGIGIGNHHMKMKMMMHMTFFWGKDGYILFSGWPGTRTGMYVLALALTFALAFIVEFLSRCRLVRDDIGRGNSTSSAVSRGLAQTLVHAIRVGLAYLIMLALMSFNGGIFIAAVLGHMVGFLIFGSGVFRKQGSQPPYVKTSDLPPANC